MNELTEEALIRRFLTEFERHGPQVSLIAGRGLSACPEVRPS